MPRHSGVMALCTQLLLQSHTGEPWYTPTALAHVCLCTPWALALGQHVVPWAQAATGKLVCPSHRQHLGRAEGTEAEQS